MEVSDGLHVLPLTYDADGRGMTLYPTVVETDRGLVLLDAGLSGAKERIGTALADAGFDRSALRLVLFTHQDADHVEGFHGLTAVEGADPLVAAHAAEAPAIDGREEPIAKGGGDGGRYDPVPVDLELVGGESLRTRAGPMHVVDTPGHTPGHVSLFFPEANLLVAGDALTAEDGRLTPPVPRFTPDWDGAITSVRKLANFELDRVICYHGGVVDADSEAVRRVHEEMREG